MVVATPTPQQHIFSDESIVSLKDIEINDIFVPLWSRILKSLICILGILFTIWHPRYQGPLLKNAILRYAHAISDLEAYLAKNHGSQSSGGVFGKGETARSVVARWERRGTNLAQKWIEWFNAPQYLYLLTSQRALYALEL